VEETKYISAKELAKILNKSTKTIDYHIKMGHLPVPVKIKNESMFLLDEINALLGVKDIHQIEIRGQKASVRDIGYQQKANRELHEEREASSL